VPKGFRDMQKELERNPKVRKISPELRKMHEIFGDQNANCGMAAQYEDGTCSRIAYDPAKMSFRKRMEIQQSTATTAAEQPLTEVQKQAERVLQFSRLINPKTRRK
jgi:hypothetical protein